MYKRPSWPICRIHRWSSPTFKFKWARDLTRWTKDNTKIGAIQRIDDTWVDSLDDLLQRETRQ